MKQIFLFTALVFVLSGCGVTLDSVVDNNLSKHYENPLLVIPYSEESFNFSKNLKYNIEGVFSQNKQKAEVLLIAIQKEELKLNNNNKNDALISNKVMSDSKDLVVMFRPQKLQYSNGSLQTASYQLVGIDVDTKREVWKANFSSSGSFGPSTFAKKSAEKIYLQLREDGVLN